MKLQEILKFLFEFFTFLIVSIKPV